MYIFSKWHYDLYAYPTVPHPGFVRSDEIREASTVQEFVDNYTEEQEEVKKKRRFQIAYETEILAEKRIAIRVAICAVHY